MGRAGTARRGLLAGFRMALGAVLASLLLAACAAEATARLPEWGRCEPTSGGSRGAFADPDCVRPARRRNGSLNGGYEWHPLPADERVQMPATPVGGAIRFVTESGTTIGCTGLGPESRATTEGPDGASTPLWELEGCASSGGVCQSADAAYLGEIDDLAAWLELPLQEGGPIPGWTGQLGFVPGRRHTPEAAIQYTVRNREPLFSPIVCTGLASALRIGGGRRGGDAFTGTIGPVDVTTNAFTETYAESEPGTQAPAKLADHPQRNLWISVDARSQHVAIVGSFQLRVPLGQEPLEIKASP